MPDQVVSVSVPRVHVKTDGIDRFETETSNAFSVSAKLSWATISVSPSSSWWVRPFVVFSVHEGAHVHFDVDRSRVVGYDRWCTEEHNGFRVVVHCAGVAL